MNYKILWLENEPDDDLIEEALETHQCELVNFDKAYSVLRELNSDRISSYDAILLDVRGVIESSTEADTADGFYMVRDRIIQLHDLGLPCAVFTAMPSITSSEGLAAFKQPIPGMEVFSKLKAKQQDECFEYLLKEISKRKETQIKKRYEPQFSFLSSKGFNSDDSKNLLRILKEIDQNILVQNEPFLSMRVILDGILEELFRKNILDRSEPIIYNSIKKAAISQNCQRLISGEIITDRSGRSIKLRNGKRIASTISYLMRSIYGLGSNDGHNTGLEDWGFSISEATKYTSHKSLVESTTQNLLVVLEYFSNWIRNTDADIEIEELKDDENLVMNGLIENIDDYGNAHFNHDLVNGKFQHVIIYKDMVEKYKISKNDNIETLTKPHNKRTDLTVAIEPITKL